MGWSIPGARAGACESGSSASPATLPRSTGMVSMTEQTKLRGCMINALEIVLVTSVSGITEGNRSFYPGRTTPHKDGKTGGGQ